MQTFYVCYHKFTCLLVIVMSGLATSEIGIFQGNGIQFKSLSNNDVSTLVVEVEH